ncbi:MAG: MiaB/RimO family radical SAM methylthiotransferase [Desulfovibrionaceae bacterium]|nr:MiaB/RimO family radical SAM methylthiotransferase [Desulfovibrionaceae bacterium]
MNDELLSRIRDHSWTFCLLTFGCKVNQYETQSLREAWTSLGGTETDDPSQADIVLLNTCAVTANAVADARQTVLKLGRQAPDAMIVLTGCAVETKSFVEAVHRSGDPDRVLIVRQKDKSRLLHAPIPCHDAQPGDFSFPPFRISTFRRSRPVLKVQDGCSHHCSYCIVPQTRGRPVSRSPRECFAELRRLLRAGYREIMISGINLRQYAHAEESCRDFWDLIRYLNDSIVSEFGSGTDRARLRISSLDPAQINEKGLETLASSSMICPHLHLSLQSGSPEILKAMHRSHENMERLLENVKRIASFWPRFGCGADVIMGFPGETEAHAEETYAVLRALPLTYAHVFPYSERPGTEAALLPDSIPVPVRAARAATARSIIYAKQKAFIESSLKLDQLTVAFDSLGTGKSTVAHGVDECYISCRMETTLLKPNITAHGLISTVPIRSEGTCLIVRPL